MRLLHVYEFRFEQFLTIPPAYAILSHRWTHSEPTLTQIQTKHHLQVNSSLKIYAFARYVRQYLPHIDWIWVDSCCIKQESTAELAEAVNCMFDWYRNAAVCIAYLADVQDATDRSQFAQSTWFKRGWTLQELLASSMVLFLTRDWHTIGHKGTAGLPGITDVGPNLERTLASITGIPQAVLEDYDNSHSLSNEVKMQWMEGRECLRPEDMYYALYGLFGVTAGVNYGEKKIGAKRRLLAAIEEKRQIETGHIQSYATTPTVAVHSIPYLRDSAFVERDELMTLRNMMRQSGCRAALSGLGGIGKTQIAIELCYRTMQEDPSIHILWIHASSAVRLDQDVRRIVEDLDIPKREDKDVNSYQLLRSWLLNAQRRWLIVLDSADETDFLHQAPANVSTTSSRLQYLPVSSNGSILMTTRRRAIAERFTDDENIIALHTDHDHAVRLLKRKLGIAEATPSVNKLASALEYIPLAIAQAAAYIKKRTPRCTIEDYLTKIEKNDESKLTMLQIESQELRRDFSDARNSILQTWQISFEHIYAVQRYAADLLGLMSFFDHQGIPSALVGPKFYNTKQADDAVAQEYFEQDLDLLKDYGFVSVSPDGSIIQMHRLVQLAARAWLTRLKKHHIWLHESIRRLVKIYPQPTYEHWKQCRTLNPHARAVCAIEATEKDASLLQASIMCKTARYLLTQGSYTEAEALARRSLELRKQLLGDQDRTTLVSMNILAHTLIEQDRLDEAEALEVQVVETSKTISGPSHADTLRNMNSLASICIRLKKYDKAEELLAEVVRVQKQSMGYEHPDTLTSMGDLAVLYSRSRRTQEAEELQLKIIEVSTGTLGMEHPDTIKRMYNLATLYWQQGRLVEAEELYVKLMTAANASLGPKHPRMLKIKEAFDSLQRQKSLLSPGLVHADVLSPVARRSRGMEDMGTMMAGMSINR